MSEQRRLLQLYILSSHLAAEAAGRAQQKALTRLPGLQDGGYCGLKQVLAVCITSKSLGDFAGFMQYGATLLFQKPCKAETVELAAIVV